VVTDVDFSDVYRARWVKSSDSFDEKLMAHYLYKEERKEGAQICKIANSVFEGHGFPTLTFWDYWRAEEQIDFAKYGWNNADWAWKIFDRVENNMDEFENYMGIAANYKRHYTEEYIVAEATYELDERLKLDQFENPIPVMVTNPDGTQSQQVDGQGRLVFEKETYMKEKTPTIMGSRPATRDLTGAEVREYKAIYRRGFKESYQRHWAKAYAQNEFDTQKAVMTAVGDRVGYEVGQKAGDQLARRQAYNAQYKAISAREYGKVAKLKYEKSFDTLIEIFENNAVVELDQATFSGSTDDSIWRNGEGIFVSFDITNLGERGGDLSLALSQTNDIEAGNPFVFRPNALSRFSADSDQLGIISEGHLAGSTAQIRMHLNNPGDLGSSIGAELNQTKNEPIEITDYAELESVNGSVDMLSGTVTVNIDVHNPAIDYEHLFKTDVVVSLDGVNKSKKKPIPAVKPERTAEHAITISGFDTMDLIERGSLTGTVKTYVAGKLADQKKFTADLEGNEKENFVAYFKALIDQGTEKARIKEVIKKLDGFLKRDLHFTSSSNKIKWNKPQKVQRSIVGKIITQYRHDLDSLNAKEKKFYLDLANTMALHVQTKGKYRVRAGLFFPKKKFLKQLAIFGGSDFLVDVKHHKNR
jgi:hypothetical protein